MSPPILPCPAINLIPQRPPMLVVDQLVARDRERNTSEVTAVLPSDSLFVNSEQSVLPELLVELIAQAMAAVNGFDAIVDGEENGTGYLVGMDDFVWRHLPEPGEKIAIEIQKKFEFGAVTVTEGKIIDSQGRIIAQGEIKAWQEGK